MNVTKQMMPDAVKAVPEPTLKRLPLYHRFLKDWQQSGRESVSCTDIGAELKLDPTQVRKDLEAAGIGGRPRIGYATAAVVDGIERFLGWKKVSEAFLVGAGSMGSALLGYRKFEECGLKILQPQRTTLRRSTLGQAPDFQYREATQSPYR